MGSTAATSPESLLIGNARIATMSGHSPYGLVDNGAVLVAGGHIAWVGLMREAPRADRQIFGITDGEHGSRKDRHATRERRPGKPDRSTRGGSANP